VLLVTRVCPIATPHKGWQGMASDIKAPGSSQETASLVKRLAGPSTGKAGFVTSISTFVIIDLADLQTCHRSN
jgi:hypothetical protein